MPSEIMAEQHICLPTFNKSDVIKIVSASDVNKAHDHNNISVKVIMSCTNTAVYPLTLIFQNFMCVGTFSTE